MSRVSDKIIEKIKEDILYYLYGEGVKARYTKEIADEIGRDKEFILRLLKDLEKRKLIRNVLKHKIRKRWVMDDLVYKKYKELY